MKNNHSIPAWDIDELVAAYPHQEFLQASAQRAWQQLQQKKRRNGTLLLLRRWVTAAAVVLLVTAPYFLLREGKVKPAGKMEGNDVQVVRLKDDPARLPATKEIRNPSVKVKPAPAPSHQPLATRHQPLAINHSPSTTRHSPLATRHEPLATNHPPLAINPPKHATILPASFTMPDSIQQLPATRTPKKIPPSVNELFDGIQKLSNMKRKAVSGPDTHNILQTGSPSAYPDTLFPTSFN